MFSSIVRALTGKPDSTLPEYVQAALSAARYMPRPGDEEDGARVAVVLTGGGLRGAFFYSREEVEKRVLARWPELSDLQVKRCISQLEAGAMNAARLDTPPRRKNWVNKFSD
jgi:hypothetical protein